MLLDLNANFDGDAWHGTPLRRLLDDVDDTMAHAHPIPNVKSMAELLAHITAWTEIVRRRVAGENVEVTEAMDAPDVTGKSWSELVARLETAHGDLIHTVARCTDKRFDQIVAGKEYTVDHMLRGLIAHHAYHGGQIALLKKQR